MSSKATNNGSRAGFKKNKKKGNSRFFQNARRFAKKGIFGHGTHIEDDEYNYFISVLDAIRADFEDIESKVNMANNVFEQTKGREVYLASNQIVSKVMEALIGFIDAEQLETFFEIFADNFRPICSDRFASHVLQKMIEIAFLRFISKDKLKQDDSEIEETEENDECEPPSAKKLKMNKKDIFREDNYNLETEFTQEHKTNCGKFVLRVGKFMLNNMEDFVWDAYGSHIIRTCLQCLSGIHVPKLAKETTLLEQNEKIYEVPSEWHDVCKEYAQRLEMWPQFSDLPYQERSSALLSVLCVALKTIDKKMLNQFGKKLTEALLIADTDEDEELKKLEVTDDEEKKTKDVLEQEKTEDGQEDQEQKGGAEEHEASGDDSIKKTEVKLLKVFQNKCSIVLLETLIKIADPELFKQIYSKLFANKLALLAKGPLSNFAVKKLIRNVKGKAEFESIFDELKEEIEDLLQSGNTAIVTALSSACLRLQNKQAQLILALQSALHLVGDKERLKLFFLCLLKLKPFEISEKDTTTFIHLHGSLLIQDLLRFNKPIFLVNCILETPPDYLALIFNTSYGSYVCHQFLESKFVGEKSRHKLLKHLEGFYVDLAITKCGSHVIESCFAYASDAQKEKLVKELAHKLNMLTGTLFGKIINQKLRVSVYRSSPEQWKAGLQRNESKAQELFNDIIN